MYLKCTLKDFRQTGKKVCVWKLEGNEILTRQEPSKYAARRYYYDASEQELHEALEEMANVSSSRPSCI